MNILDQHGTHRRPIAFPQFQPAGWSGRRKENCVVDVGEILGIRTAGARDDIDQCRQAGQHRARLECFQNKVESSMDISLMSRSKLARQEFSNPTYSDPTILHHDGLQILRRVWYSFATAAIRLRKRGSISERW